MQQNTHLIPCFCSVIKSTPGIRQPSKTVVNVSGTHLAARLHQLMSNGGHCV